jgi:hypothetical protein
MTSDFSAEFPPLQQHPPDRRIPKVHYILRLNPFETFFEKADDFPAVPFVNRHQKIDILGRSRPGYDSHGKPADQAVAESFLVEKAATGFQGFEKSPGYFH